MGQYHTRIWIGEGRMRMAEIVDVKKLVEKHEPAVCVKCGCVTEKAKYVCMKCRKKLNIRGTSDVERYFLVRHLLELVREGRA